MIPPAKLPTWRDVPCEGAPCESDLCCKFPGVKALFGFSLRNPRLRV